MERYPDYELRSRTLAKLCEDNAAVKAAQTAIYKDLIDNVATIKELRDHEAVEPSVRLGAAKHLLKLAGLEIERKQVEHGGNILISRDQAEEIVGVAELMEGAE